MNKAFFLSQNKTESNHISIFHNKVISALKLRKQSQMESTRTSQRFLKDQEILKRPAAENQKQGKYSKNQLLILTQ